MVLRNGVEKVQRPAVYTSKDFADACRDVGITQSMGAVGTSADNALAESFNAAFKREVLRDATSWPDETTCRRQAFRWLTRYNTRRRGGVNSWKQRCPSVGVRRLPVECRSPGTAVAAR